MTEDKIGYILKDEWRQLGFYYDFDERLEVNQWRFFGSKSGFQNFVNLLDNYVSNPVNNRLSEHNHYGPYCYLKIMTWDKAKITSNYICGIIDEIKGLKKLVADK